MPDYYCRNMEASEYCISRYCLIRNKRIILNGEKIIEESEGANFSAFLSSVYKTFGSEYPKFYKMDLLSKLGFLTTDFLVDSGKCLNPYESDQIGFVASNSQSSLETDANYLETIADKDNYYPNPGIFVYTLPNLLIGEVSIKFDIKGESIFFVSQLPDFENLRNYAISLLNSNTTEAVILGWVDLSFTHDYESILFLVENSKLAAKSKETWPFSAEAMEDLYFEKNLEQ